MESPERKPTLVELAASKMAESDGTASRDEEDQLDGDEVVDKVKQVQPGEAHLQFV